VTVIRLVTMNSHDQWRDSKQLDKSVVDSATRAFSSEFQELLIKLLNEANVQVRNAHESVKGRKILDGRDVLPLSTDEFFLEDINSDDLNLNIGHGLASVHPTRNRAAPKRLVNEVLSQFSNYFGRKRRGANSDASSDQSEDSSDEYQDTSSQSTKSGGTDDIDEDAEDIIQPTQYTVQQLKRNFRRLEYADQEQFDQDEMNLRLILSLSPDRVYTMEDLNDKDVLDRALRLLFINRSGQENLSMRISPHIKYDKLPTSVAKAISLKLRVENRKIGSYFGLVSTAGHM
jgi:hypothetical protein